VETEDRFKNSPIHDKVAILDMLDKLEPKEMVKVVAFIQNQIILSSGNYCDCEIKGSSFELDNGTICCCKCEKERSQ
jgi:hypothetical protein